MSARVIPLAALGALYGAGLGLSLIITGSMLIGGPVAPVAMITLLYLPITAGALFGAAAAYESD